MKAILFLLLCCGLTACGHFAPPERTYNHRLQTWQTFSREAEVFRDGQDKVLVQAVIYDDGGTNHRYALMLRVLRRGPNGPIVESIRTTPNRNPVNYQRIDRLRAYCIDRCHKVEVGLIKMTPATFHHFASHGFDFEIIGRRRYYDAVVPPEIFAQALAAAGLTQTDQNP